MEMVSSAIKHWNISGWESLPQGSWDLLHWGFSTSFKNSVMRKTVGSPPWITHAWTYLCILHWYYIIFYAADASIVFVICFFFTNRGHRNFHHQMQKTKQKRRIETLDVCWRFVEMWSCKGTFDTFIFQPPHLVWIKSCYHNAFKNMESEWKVYCLHTRHHCFEEGVPRACSITLESLEMSLWHIVCPWPSPLAPLDMRWRPLMALN